MGSTKIDTFDLDPSVFSGSGSVSSDVLFTINALLSDDEYQNEWAFRQTNIGAAINQAYELNCAELEACTSVEDIAANSTAMVAITSNDTAMEVCGKNSVLGGSIDEAILAQGLGYQKYNVGDLVTLKYNGVDTKFRVVHKNYLVSNKIVLVSENILESKQWHNSNTNNYSTSDIRTYLNSTVLGRFSTAIQNAIQAVPLACHNNTTAVTCTDKIWLLSFAEVGFGTNTYAPVEGTALSYFTDNNKRIKTLNGSAAYWWLRTPYTGTTTYSWGVSNAGTSANNTCSGSNGLVPALVI